MKSLQKNERKAAVAKRERPIAREKMDKLKPFKLKRDLFLIHGWGDQANVCWMEPYIETDSKKKRGKQTRRGGKKKEDWGYTFKDWAEEKIENYDKRVHFIKLVKDEKCVRETRDGFGKCKVYLDNEDKQDRTYYYTSFFEFAELLKEKISEKRGTKEIDVLCHSMGGLDTVAAIAIDPEDDVTDFITTPILEGVHNLITVATPHRGSPKANLMDLKIAKWILGSSEYIALQGSNMHPSSQFVRRVNELKVRKRLLERISHLYIFGASGDPVVPSPHHRLFTKDIDKKVVRDKVTETDPFLYCAHSQRNGITQDIRLIQKVFDILL